MPEILYETNYFYIYLDESGEDGPEYVMVNKHTGVEEYKNILFAIVVKTAVESSAYLKHYLEEDEPVSEEA